MRIENIKNIPIYLGSKSVTSILENNQAWKWKQNKTVKLNNIIV